MHIINNRIKVGVIIVSGDKVLLIKEKLKKNTIPLWNIVKGSYGDNAPETIFQAAVREAKEEAGVDVKVVNLLGVYISQLNDGVWTQFTFLAETIGGSPTLAKREDQEVRDEDISELKWHSKIEVAKMCSSDFVSHKIYLIIQDWLNSEVHSLIAVKQLTSE